jgi:glycosyltransferase involved in cell wall biosynthesis
MARQGHECLILTSDANHLASVPDLHGSHLLHDIEGVKVCWIRTRKYVGAKSIGRVLSWLDFEWQLWRLRKGALPRPDAVIVSSLSLLTVFNGLWLRWRFRCRLIFEIRDIWPLTLVEEGGFSPWNPLVIALGWVERLGYRRADAIVGTMPNLAAHVKGQVASAAPVHAIPFGVDPDALGDGVSVPPEWVERHVLKGRFVVCHAGTIGITNALETLFDCARMMHDDPDVHFLIVGEGDLKEHYQAASADLSNVTFTGPVPKQMVQSVLRRVDLVYFATHPSKVWDYGMSLNKVVDYMLAARPVVGSYSGFRTMIEEAGCGSMVPAQDPTALRSEIERYRGMSAEQRATMGARGRAWLLEHRTYRELAAKYVEIALPEGSPSVSAQNPSAVQAA